MNNYIILPHWKINHPIFANAQWIVII